VRSEKYEIQKKTKNLQPFLICAKNSLMKFRILFTAILIYSLFFFSSMAFSQPYVDLVNLKLQYFTPTSFQFDNADKQSTVQVDGRIFLPLEQKNKNIFFIGASYTSLKVESTLQGNKTSTVNFYGQSVILGYEFKTVNTKLRTLILAMPRLNTGLSGMTERNMQYGGVLLFKYRLKENLKIQLGLYYNKEYFGNYFVPLVGINWKANERINLFGNLPTSTTFEYKLSEKFYTGLGWTSLTSSYRSENSSDLFYVRDGVAGKGSNQLRLFLDTYITKQLVFYLQGGYTFKHYFELYSQDTNDLYYEIPFKKTENGLCIGGGIAYRVRR
jgi:hypothetical protein